MSARLENGARFSFVRKTSAQDLPNTPQVTYKVSIEIPGPVFYECECTLSADSPVPSWLDPEDGPSLDPWMTKWRDSLARQLQRAGARGQWSRKLRQWKAAPDA